MYIFKICWKRIKRMVFFDVISFHINALLLNPFPADSLSGGAEYFPVGKEKRRERTVPDFYAKPITGPETNRREILERAGSI